MTTFVNIGRYGAGRRQSVCWTDSIAVDASSAGGMSMIPDEAHAADDGKRSQYNKVEAERRM